MVRGSGVLWRSRARLRHEPRMKSNGLDLKGYEHIESSAVRVTETDYRQRLRRARMTMVETC